MEGYDMTKINETDESSTFETLLYIQTCIQKLNALNYLRSNKTSLHDKIKYIENCRVELDLVYTREIKPNITAGGLLKDWDFEI
jgi:hypothetical protein